MRGEVLVTGDRRNRVPGVRRFAGPSSLLLCVAHAPHHGRTRGCGGRLPGPPLGSLPGLGRLVLEGLGPRRLPVVPDQTPRQLRPAKTVRNPDFTAVSPFARHAAGSPVPCVVRWPAAARWTCSPVSTAQTMTFTAVVKSSTPAPSPPRATVAGRLPFRASALPCRVFVWDSVRTALLTLRNAISRFRTLLIPLSPGHLRGPAFRELSSPRDGP